MSNPWVQHGANIHVGSIVRISHKKALQSTGWFFTQMINAGQNRFTVHKVIRNKSGNIHSVQLKEVLEAKGHHSYLLSYLEVIE
jgi:hypothetical protein